jgi:hypothetical protein
MLFHNGCILRKSADWHFQQIHGADDNTGISVGHHFLDGNYVHLQQQQNQRGYRNRVFSAGLHRSDQ